MLKQFKTTLQKFSTDLFLRNDLKFFDYKNNFERKFSESFRLKEILKYYYKWYAFKWDDFKTDWDVFVLKWVDFIDWYEIDFNSVNYLPEDFLDEYKRFKVSKDEIVISLVWSIWKIAYIRENYDMLLNQNNIALKVDEEKYNSKFFLYLIDLFLKWMLEKLYNWSWYSFLRIEELFNIILPKLSLPTQNEIVSKIEPIEQKIKELKSQIKEQKDVINLVFARDFGFDLEKFEKLKSQKNFNLNFFEFANNIDVRQSVKFHREAWKFVISELQKISNKKVKDFISEPIVLWTSVSPNDYDENWDFYYISMANIKNWKFESENSQLVSVEYSKKNQNKIVQKDDILIARSWEWTIWKVAIIQDDEINWIFADFTMRIRLENYNSLFAYYYFSTEYFQYIVEVNKKWLWNNTNIFPSQIREFPLPDISLLEQQKIVDEIKQELDKQEIIKKDIEKERSKIDMLIEESIRGI